MEIVEPCVLCEKTFEDNKNLQQENATLREYIKHLETCSRCDEGFYQMCGKRDELRRRAGVKGGDA